MSKTTLNIGKYEDGGAVALSVAKLVESRMLVAADSGGGKSYLLRRILEQASKTTQTIVIDPEGEFATLREKRDMVLAGPDGDVPAEPRSASLLCRRLMELNLSAVIDIQELSPRQRQDFVASFCHTMIDLPRSLWRPCFVVIDEIHDFAPEGGKSFSGEAVAALSSKGRKRGFCLIGATQRYAKAANDVIAGLKNVCLGTFSLDTDIKRAAGVLGFSKERWPEIRDLSSREGHEGEFFGFGPAFNRRGVHKLRGGEVETTHPKSGQGRIRPPEPSSKIAGVLKELTDLPKEAEQEIKDLAAARQRIVQLERELKQQARVAAPAAKAAVADASAKQQARKDAAVISQLRKALEEAMKVVAKINSKGFEGTDIDPKIVTKALETAADQIVKQVSQTMTTRLAEFERLKKEASQLLLKLQKLLSAEDLNVQVDVTHNEPFTVTAPAAGQTYRSSAGVSGIAEGAPDWMQPAHQKLLDALAWLSTFGVDAPERGIVAAVAGVSPNSSSFTNNVSRLNTSGLIRYPGEGRMTLTGPGAVLARGPENAPTLEELHKAWKSCPAFQPAHVKLLSVVIEAYPDALSRTDLAAAAGVSEASSSYTNNVSRLSSMGLIEYPEKGFVRATKLLFPDALAASAAA